MSDTPKAVFLSYAREDTEPAKRIADALRAFGVEVWFDQSELRGGDQWDAKIRTQIKTCALFVPIISATTQARPEGYFRREWLLAAERTRDMAAGVAFIVPLAIDDTPEADASVPEEFMRFQWTRLVHGVPSPQFVEQVKRLLESPRKAAAARSATSGAPRPPAQKKFTRMISTAMAVIVIGGVAAFFLSRKSEPPAAAQAPGDTKGAPAATPQGEVRKLVEKAKALQEDYAQDDTLRENLTLAEQLCKRAVELDPSDGEAWAIYARVTLGLLYNETSNVRLEQGHSQAQRAMQLAPDSIEARMAMADYYRKQRTTLPEAERIMREVVQRAPSEKRALRMLGLVLRSAGKTAEALVYYDRAIALPGGDAKSLITRAQILFTRDQFAEAEASINEALALRPTAAARILKLYFVMSRGELVEARALLEQIPASSLVEDRAVTFASRLWLWIGEPEKCLAVLSGTSHDYLVDTWVAQSKGFLAGQAHQLAGRADAAMAEWRTALQVIERRLVAQPNEILLLSERAQLLALLGERAEAERAMRLFEQLAPKVTMGSPSSPNVAGPNSSVGNTAGTGLALAGVLTALGRKDEAMQHLAMALAGATTPYMRSALRYDPLWATLRGDARFAALLKQADAKK
jgi:tetratricopeptide (TPR) repeat protein